MGFNATILTFFTINISRELFRLTEKKGRCIHKTHHYFYYMKPFKTVTKTDILLYYPRKVKGTKCYGYFRKCTKTWPVCGCA